MNERPNPDELLKVVANEEMRSKMGKLKIFLGLAAGVGKTYAMLKEAQKLQKEGVNLAVGIVETHGRNETADLLKGLKIIPLKTQTYKNKEFQELDVEAVIHLHPSIVLVDELAHQNVPGSKHLKRWQDVLEILENGIDVFTTLNVQHIESLNDIVRGITEIYVRETVPDHVIDSAASIQLVDLTPDELLQRLAEGRVYFDEQSKTASLNFFKKEKLTALRELALRYAANKIDHDLHSMALQEEKMLYWKPREKFLTAIDASQRSQKLIRTTKRLATAIDAPWIAVNVETGTPLSDSETEQLSRNFALARDLGAEVIHISDPSVINGIERLVKQRGITQIVVGRSDQLFFQNIFGKTFIDRLTVACQDVDIHIVKDEKNDVLSKRTSFFSPFQFNRSNEYLHIALIASILAFIIWISLSYLNYLLSGVIFIAGILIISLFYKRGPVLFAAMLFAIFWNFLFITPYYSLAIHSYEDVAMFIIYTTISFAVGILITREKENKELLEKSEESTRALYEMVRQIATAPSTDAILKFILEKFKRLLHGSFEFGIRNLEGTIPWKDLHLINSEKEKTAAIWTLNHGKESGWSTDTLPSLENLYIPLKGYHENVGLLIYRPHRKLMLSTDEKNFIYTVCQQLSNYLERILNQEKIYQHDNLLQVQKIHKTILERLTHVFQWPIESAKAALNSLKVQIPNHPQIQKLEDSLDIFIKNLTNIATMTDLSEGMIPLKKSQHSIVEVIEECTLSLTSLLKDHNFKMNIEENLPLLSFDYYLIQVVVNNLLLDAIEYSDSNSSIEIEIKKLTNSVIVSISNEGKKIPEDQLPYVFDKFYRLPNEDLPRSDLGLAISKTIIELHQGEMKAQNIQDGICLSFSLPI